jgi:hypothetical protein
MFLANAYAQDGNLERDSLPVFVIQDEELRSIFDDFIAEARKMGYHNSQDYGANINVVHINFTDEMSLLLNVRKQHETLDFGVLYRNPNYHQAFIKHNDILVRTHIKSYSNSFNYHILTGMLKVLPVKQTIYFKDPPSGFYDLNRMGGDPMDDTLLDSYCEYYDTKWHRGIRITEEE